MAQVWIINTTPTLPSTPLDVYISFNSAGTAGYYGPFERICMWPDLGIYYGWPDDAEIVYQVGYEEWVDQGHRTITFETEPTGQLLTWLQANAVISSNLCFTAEQANSTLGYEVHGTVDTSRIEKSTDQINWEYWIDGTPITLNNIGDKVYIRNMNNTLSSTVSNYFKFNMTGLIAASGNLNNMINNTNLTQQCYRELFEDCASLTSAPELPSLTLANGCYTAMFRGCTSLKNPPALPAITLDIGCYLYLFYGCTSLISVPELPATTLVNACYLYMFQGCSKLIISDTETSEAATEWRIPSSGTFTNTTTCNQLMMFDGCSGVRSSDTMSGAPGENHTYYYGQTKQKKFLKNSSGKYWKSSSGKIFYINH